MTFILKFLLIVFCLIWIARTIFRFAFQRFMVNLQKQAEELKNQQEANFRQQQDSQAEEEGKIRVDKTKPASNPSIIGDMEGDYVDFEEIPD